MNRSIPIQKLLHDLAPTAAEKVYKGVCISCEQPFSEKNVFTRDGAREVAISGCCEKCFDKIFQEGADDGV